MKRMLCLLLTVVVLLSLVPAASAFDYDADCSIEILVKYNGTNITGGKLKAVKVGQPDRSEAVFKKVTNGEIITDIGTKKAVTDMVSYYNANKSVLTPITVNVVDGKAVFNDLAVGLYLIFQEDAATGYNNLAPFLVTLPYIDDDGVIHYDLTVSSKTELYREPNKPTRPSGNTGTKLPQTGQLTWPVPVLASAGMLLFALGWWLCFGRRKDSYET